MNIIVPATYPPECKIVFVGEAPGADECEQREGFVGQAGKLLQKIIYTSGLSWNEIGRTNVVKRPPDCDCGHLILEHGPVHTLGQRGQDELAWRCGACTCRRYNGFDTEHFTKTFYETTREGKKKVVRRSGELIEWCGLLKGELERERPNVAVACGNEALKALCNTEGITKYRGSVLPSTLVEGLKVVPLVHPSAILRGAQWQEVFVSSEIVARKVVPHASSPKLEYDPWHEILEPNIQQVEAYVNSVSGEFTVDIETRAGSIACVGLNWFDGNLDRSICVPVQTTRGPYFDHAEDEHTFWRVLAGLFARYPAINHNIFYDLDWLFDYGMVPRVVHDTMVLFHRYYPELPKSLGFVNMWFNDIPYYKDDGKTWGSTSPDVKLWSYNIKDVVATHRIWRKLRAMGETTHKREWAIYNEYTRACMSPAFEMQLRGMEATPESVTFARQVLVSELAKIRIKLAELSNGELAIRVGNKKITDKQAMMYLYGVLKLPAKHNRKTKALTADEDALIELLIQFPDCEVLQALNAERKFGKALNSYIDINWLEDVA